MKLEHSRERLNELNNMLWGEMLNNGSVEILADEAYELSTKIYSNDIKYIGNDNLLDINYKAEDLQADVFDDDHDRFGFKKNISTYGTLNVLKFGPETQEAKVINNFFNLKTSYSQFHVQPSGGTITTHVDLNRTMTKQCNDLGIEVKSKNIKKYIWFLDDQQLGQYFIVGRNQLSWKAGDIYSWDWYVPHATGNSSNSERRLLFISGR
jgi:hypothetical protein